MARADAGVDVNGHTHNRILVVNAIKLKLDCQKFNGFAYKISFTVRQADLKKIMLIIGTAIVLAQSAYISNPNQNLGLYRGLYERIQTLGSTLISYLQRQSEGHLEEVAISFTFIGFSIALPMQNQELPDKQVQV